MPKDTVKYTRIADIVVRVFYMYGGSLMKRGQLCQPGADYLVESPRADPRFAAARLSLSSLPFSACNKVADETARDELLRSSFTSAGFCARGSILSSDQMKTAANVPASLSSFTVGIAITVDTLNRASPEKKSREHWNILDFSSFFFWRA